MDLELDGRVAVVTAASKGIGLAVTRALAGEGTRVVAGARSVGTLEGLDGVTPVALDLRRRRARPARRAGAGRARARRRPGQQRRRAQEFGPKGIRLPRSGRQRPLAGPGWRRRDGRRRHRCRRGHRAPDDHRRTGRLRHRALHDAGGGRHARRAAGVRTDGQRHRHQRGDRRRPHQDDLRVGLSPPAPGGGRPRRPGSSCERRAWPGSARRGRWRSSRP